MSNDDEVVLAKFIHVSDIHFHQGTAGDRAEQRLILNAIVQDVKQKFNELSGEQKLLFVTGDVGYAAGIRLGSDGATEYESATTWISSFLNSTGMSKSDAFLVPGNHDVQRPDEPSERNVKRLVQAIRAGGQTVDDALAHPDDSAMLASRMSAYTKFSEGYGPRQIKPEPKPWLYWQKTATLPGNFTLKIIGFNTALMSLDETDEGSLFLGKEPLANSFAIGKNSNEIIIAMAHHPLDWLSDAENARGWLEGRVDAFLCGHVHLANSSVVRRGDGGSLCTIVSGAAHSSEGDGAMHAYSYGQLLISNGYLTIKLFPRVWCNQKKDFIVDTSSTPKDSNSSTLTLRKIEGSHAGSVEVRDADEAIVESNGAMNLEIELSSGANAAVTGDFPPLVSTWVGRETELRELMSDGYRVFAIDGIGGQGKSALAGNILSSNWAVSTFEYRDWRDCKEQGDRFQTQMVSIISTIHNVGQEKYELKGCSNEQLVDIFFNVLGKKPGIFVFDNIDHYVDVDGKVAIGAMGYLIKSALERSHESKFIFTCRPKIQYYQDGFLEIKLNGFTLEETKELFKKRGVSHSNFKENEIEIENMWKETGGHPLWLNIIARQVARGHMDFAGILMQIRKNQPSELPRPMLKAIWGSLSKNHHTILRCLAETVRPETEMALWDILGKDPGLNKYRQSIKMLENIDLVVIKHAGDRGGERVIELHPLIKEFVKTEFPQEEQNEFILKIVKVFDRLLGIFRARLSVNAPYEIMEHWTQRAELSINCQQYDSALVSLHEVGGSMVGRGHSEEFIRVCDKLFQAIDWQIEITKQTPHFDRVFNVFIEALGLCGQYDRAARLLEKYEKTLEGKGARYIHFCDMQCSINWARGNFENAILWGEKGYRVKNESGLDTAYSCDHHLALSRRDGGRIDDALQYFLLGCSIDEVVDGKIKREDTGSFYGNIGRCLQLKGDLDGALKCLIRSAIYLLKSEKYLDNQGYATLWLAELLDVQGDPKSALYFYAFAVNKWKNLCPPRAQKIEEDKISALIQRFPELQDLNLEEIKVESKCNNWLDAHRDL